MGDTHTEDKVRSIRKRRTERRQITDGEVDALCQHYARAFGSRGAVQEVIDKALNHTGRLKALDELVYVERTWLRGDLRKMHRPLPPTLVANSAIEELEDDDPLEIEMPETCAECGTKLIDHKSGKKCPVCWLKRRQALQIGPAA